MTMQDLLALPDGELNKLAAEALGWKWMTVRRDFNKNSPTFLRVVDNDGNECDTWNPETDHNDAARMRDECLIRGDNSRFGFVDTLLEITGYPSRDSDDYTARDLLAIANATPREITAAAVWVMMGEGVIQ